MLICDLIVREFVRLFCSKVVVCCVNIGWLVMGKTRIKKTSYVKSYLFFYNPHICFLVIEE